VLAETSIERGDHLAATMRGAPAMGRPDEYDQQERQLQQDMQAAQQIANDRDPRP
jgi:hypothetical protein